MPRALGDSYGANDSALDVGQQWGRCPAYGGLIVQYRRAKTPGATYFFTVVTFRRRKILCEPDNLNVLRTAFKTMQTRHPFVIDAFVLLPEPGLFNA